MRGKYYLEVIHLGRVIKGVTDTSTALQRQQGDLETILHYPSLTSNAGASHKVNGLQTS